MWGKRKFKTTAVAVIDQPKEPPPIVNNYNQTPWPGIIFMSFVCLVLLFPLFWFALVFVFEQMGYAHPERAVAWWLIALPFGGGGLWYVGWIIGNLLDRIFDYKREIAAIVLEVERTKLLQSQSDVSGMRMTEADRSFARLILAVMFDAYQHGPKGARGEIRWSRRQAKALADEHKLGLSGRQCGRLAGWLLRYGVITDRDEINTKQYGDLGDVKALVSRVYNVPVQVVDNIGMTGQHLHGASGDSWG